MTTTTQYLACILDKGMFSDEVAVTYPRDGAPKKSVFVPKHRTIGSPGASGKVQVVVVSRNNRVYAVLPSAESDLVEVDSIDLSERP